MNLRSFSVIGVVGLVACGPKAVPPKDGKVDLTGLKSKFTNAPSEVREDVAFANSALAQGKALEAFNALSYVETRSDLTLEQQQEAAKAKLEAYRQLQKAAANGDAKAQQAVEQYRATR